MSRRAPKSWRGSTVKTVVKAGVSFSSPVIARHIATAHCLRVPTYGNEADTRLYQVHALYLETLRIGVKMHGLAVEARLALKAAAAADAIQTGAVIHQVDDGIKLSEVPRWQQGNADLNTLDTLRARQKLRRASAVLEVLDAFWKCATQSDGDTIQDQDSDEVLTTRGAFRCLYLRAYKYLIDPWDPNDAEQLIQQDWQEEVAGTLQRARSSSGSVIPALPVLSWHNLITCRSSISGMRASCRTWQVAQVCHTRRFAMGCLNLPTTGRMASALPSTPNSYGRCTVGAARMADGRIWMTFLLIKVWISRLTCTLATAICRYALTSSLP